MLPRPPLTNVVASLILAGSLVFCQVESVRGDLVLNISGIAGSSLINWEATGSVTVTGTIPGVSSANGRAPVGSIWSSSFADNLGDLIINGVADDSNIALTGSISYRLNNAEFGVIDMIDLEATSTSGGDEILLHPSSSIDYPSLVSNNEVSWIGSGTFNLSVETFDTFFIPGSYSNSINGGNYVVNIITVPEPSSFFLVAVPAFAGVFLRKRRRQEKRD